MRQPISRTHETHEALPFPGSITMTRRAAREYARSVRAIVWIILDEKDPAHMDQLTDVLLVIAEDINRKVAANNARIAAERAMLERLAVR
jgi:hypothetical protein